MCVKDDCAQVIDELKIADGEKKFYLIKWNDGTKEYKNHYFTNIIDIDYKKYLSALCECGFDEFE